MKYSAVTLGYEVRESATWENIIKYATVMCKKYQEEVVFIRVNGERYASFQWNVEANDMMPAYQSGIILLIYKKTI